MSTFSEADHPRSGSGQFTDKTRTENDVHLDDRHDTLIAEYDDAIHQFQSRMAAVATREVRAAYPDAQFLDYEYEGSTGRVGLSWVQTGLTSGAAENIRPHVTTDQGTWDGANALGHMLSAGFVNTPLRLEWPESPDIPQVETFRLYLEATR